MVAGELKDVVPVEEEAMVLLMLENYEQTWAWQAMVRKEEGIEIEAHKKKIGSDKFCKSQPATLYSDAEGGNNKCGGWEEEGLIRFAEVRDKIKEARKNRECRKVEQQFQRLLERKYPKKNKKKPKTSTVAAPQERTSVAFGAGRKKRAKGAKANLHAVHDSDEEKKKLQAVLNFDEKTDGEKAARKAAKKAAKKPAKRGKGKNNEVAAEVDEEEVEGEVADALESSEEEDDDLIRGPRKPSTTNKKDAATADGGGPGGVEEDGDLIRAPRKPSTTNNKKDQATAGGGGPGGDDNEGGGDQ